MIVLLLLFSVFLLTTAPSDAGETFSISYDGRKVVHEYPGQTRPVIGLALSGGSARGIAHIGVIEVLEEQGIRIERIAGTSMGSIVGGLYAAGYRPGSLEQMLQDIVWSEYFSNDPRRRSIYVTQKETITWPLFDVRFQGFRAKLPSSLSSGQKIISFLSWLTLRQTFECGRDFDKLDIPFRSVTTDLNTGETVILGSGNLARAIQASSMIPLIFTPVDWEGKRLVDGGLKNNLPVSVVKDMGSDFVIAVAIDESMHPSSDLENPLLIADQTTSILMRNLTALYKQQADFLISPDMEEFSSRNFDDIHTITEQGRAAARDALPSLLAALEKKKTSYRKTYISSISISPEQEHNSAAAILARHVQTDAENYFAEIADGLEELWDTGRYWEIQAQLDEDQGILNVDVKQIPDTVTLVLRDNAGGESYNREYEIGIHINSPRNFNDVTTSVDSLLRQLRSEGPSFVGITDIQLGNSPQTLTFYATIPQVTGIFLDKNLKSRTSVITREFDFITGDTADMNKFMTAVENLYGTNLFNWVYADVEPYGDGVGLSINLNEKDMSVVRLGLRYDETNKTEGRIAFSRENILGFGNEFTAVGHSGYRKKLYMFETQSDRIYKTLYTFNIKAYRLFQKRPLYENHSLVNDYEVDRYGIVISLGQQMDKLGNAVVQFRSERSLTRFPLLSNRDNAQKEIRSLIMQSLIDSYDRYPFPNNGFINHIFIESAQEYLGGTEQFVKLYWGGSFIKTFLQKHSFSCGFSLGSADPSTPDVESFSLGGSPTRLNCYNSDSAQTQFYSDFQGLHSEEKYGNYLAVGKLGYRLFIPRYFYLSLLYNIGNVWDNDETMTADTLLQSCGIEGSFATYMGPLSFGWGITSEGDDRFYMSGGWGF